MSVEQRGEEETKQRRWSSGFSWADDDSDSDSDSDDEDEDYAPVLVKSASQVSLSSSSSRSSSSSSLTVKSVRFAPIAEMRLIPSVVDLVEMARGTQELKVFVENNARTIML